MRVVLKSGMGIGHQSLPSSRHIAIPSLGSGLELGVNTGVGSRVSVGLRPGQKLGLGLKQCQSEGQVSDRGQVQDQRLGSRLPKSVSSRGQCWTEVKTSARVGSYQIQTRVVARSKVEVKVEFGCYVVLGLWPGMGQGWGRCLCLGKAITFCTIFPPLYHVKPSSLNYRFINV